VIVDANVLASAFLGRTMEMLIDMRTRGIELLMPDRQYVESRSVARRKGGWTGARFDAIAVTVIEVLPHGDYALHEAAARARLGPRGQADWPVLAAALAFEDQIWSNDRDFFGVGVAVWSTANIGHVQVMG
jgi:predicted nucleic acid-binding protein